MLYDDTVRRSETKADPGATAPTEQLGLENNKITSNSGMLGVSWSLGETNPANCKDVSSRQCDCGVPQIRLRTYPSVYNT